jgi:hypothetical protein
MHLRGAHLFALLLLSAAAAPASAQMDVQVAFPNLPYFSTLTGLVDPLDGTGRLFALEKNGPIRVFNNNPNVSTWRTFLDLSDSTANTFECGVLDIAFPRDYAQNGYFYVTYINKAREPLKWVLERYHVSADPNVADPNSALRLIECLGQVASANEMRVQFEPADQRVAFTIFDFRSFGKTTQAGSKPILVTLPDLGKNPDTAYARGIGHTFNNAGEQGLDVVKTAKDPRKTQQHR